MFSETSPSSSFAFPWRLILLTPLHRSVGHSYVSCGEMSAQAFAQVLVGFFFFCFLTTECCKYFLLFCRSLFILLIVKETILSLLFSHDTLLEGHWAIDVCDLPLCLLFHRLMCLLLRQPRAVWMTVALSWVFTPGRVELLCLFFVLHIVLATGSHMYFKIFLFFSITMRVGFSRVLPWVCRTLWVVWKC